MGGDLLPLQQANGRIHRHRRRAGDAEGEVLIARPGSLAQRRRESIAARFGRIGALVALLFGLALGASGAGALDLPALTGRVVDQANILSPDERAALVAKLKDLEDKSGIQLVVATVSSLGGQEIEPYANQLFRTWKLGEAKKNNGVLFLIAPNEHRMRIEVGYGLEGTLTDATSSIIIANAVAPRFKAGDFNGGVSRGVDDIITTLTADSSEWQKRPEFRAKDSSNGISGVAALLAIAAFLFVFFLIARSQGGFGSALFYILTNIVLSSGRSDGGSFSSGGGDSGFSGGGGSSGGGGASGSW
jgi:uncharacterized protein